MVVSGEDLQPRGFESWRLILDGIQHATYFIYMLKPILKVFFTKLSVVFAGKAPWSSG